MKDLTMRLVIHFSVFAVLSYFLFLSLLIIIGNVLGKSKQKEQHMPEQKKMHSLKGWLEWNVN